MNKSFVIYVAVCVSSIFVGIMLTTWLTRGPQETPSPISEQAASFASLVPDEFAFTEPFQDEPQEVPEKEIPEKPAVPAIPAVLEVPVPTVIQSPELPVELSGLFSDTAEEPFVPEPIILPPVVIPQPPVAQMDEVKIATASTVADPVEEVSVAPTTVAPVAVATATTPVSHVYFYTGIPVRPAPVPIVPMNTFVYASSYASVVFTHTSVMQPYVVPAFTPQVVPVWVGTPTLVYSNEVIFNSQFYCPHYPVRMREYGNLGNFPCVIF